MAVSTAAGSRLFIGTTASDPLADTFTEVGEVTNLGTFGRAYDNVPYSNLGNRNVTKLKGQRDDGTMSITVGRFATDAGQTRLRIALDNDFDYNFKLLLDDQLTPPTGAVVTIAIATPGLITWTAHGLLAGTPVVFSTTGTLPTGIVAGTTYYVIATGLTANAFEIAATTGGVAINTTGSQAGTHSAVASGGTPTTFTFKAKVMTYQTSIGAPNDIVSAAVSLGITSGSIVETPAS